MRPSVTRERKRQYVRASRSRYIGDHSSSSARVGRKMSAACTLRIAPVRLSSCETPPGGSQMTACAAARPRRRRSRLFTLPLERIGEIPLQSFAREAPALCAQVVRALESDAELERMAAPVRSGGGAEPAPARRLRELAAARDGPAA